MNIKSLTSITVNAIALGIIAVPFLSHSSNAKIKIKEAEDRPSDRVTFYCGTVLEEKGGKTPTTLAYVPQRKAHIPIVAWTSNNLAAWSPQRRCESVSMTFQTFYEDGRLNYLTNGESAGYPIICALLNEQEECSSENQLFQVRAGTNPEDVIVGLEEILNGKTSGTEVIQQSSSGRSYISVSELLENAPRIAENLITK